MQAAAGADAHQFQLAQFRFYFAGVEVDVGQRVQLVHHDVDVVAPYAGAHHRDALAPAGAGDGVELAALHLVLARVEVPGHKGHAPRVAHQDDFVGQPFGPDVEVEHGTIVVDDEFGRRKILFHICVFLLL